MAKEKIELNEQKVYECKAHWCNLIVPGLVALFFIGVFATAFSNPNDRSISIWFLLFAVASFGIPFWKIKSCKLVLTDKRIYGKTGIIKTKSLSAPLSKVQTVNIDKKLFGRIFGYADITIHCITGVYIFKKQSNAEEMQNAILNTIK